jgi:DNA-directed RNA polymerase specialized sigma subunit
VRIARPLSKHETAVLLRAVDSAAAASKELRAGALDEARREELRQLVGRGMSAKSQLVAEHLWHAEYHARRAATSCRGRRHSVEDLTQEALVGLLWAIERFDRNARYPFGEYAGIVMHEAVRRFLAKDARRRRELQDSAA